ncbi:MAG: hypothetical protein CMG26_06305 [Candidatus Marinimicrobia bacterium]|nr:hypothetical protein [Candidatus Neomarinimicrobiota bacterium]
MIFNRDDKCTEEEKEYYDMIGEYTVSVFIIFFVMCLFSFIENYPLLKSSLLLLFFGFFIASNLILTSKLSSEFNKWPKGEEDMWWMITLIGVIIIYFFFGFYSVYKIFGKREPIGSEYLFYIPCIMHIILFFLIWIFDSCEKIKHRCSVESWPENQKGEDKKNEREDYCNNLNEICMDDMNKSEDECGICSDTNYNNKDDCTSNDGEWTSKYTKCFWSKPTDKKVSSCDIVTDSPPLEPHEGSCIYDINKCGDNDSICNDFQPTSIFYDCCSKKTIGWQENMPQLCDTLTTQIEENKTQEGRIGGPENSQRAGELEAEYNLRVAASNQTSHIHDQDLYK